MMSVTYCEMFNFLKEKSGFKSASELVTFVLHRFNIDPSDHVFRSVEVSLSGFRAHAVEKWKIANRDRKKFDQLFDDWLKKVYTVPDSDSKSVNLNVQCNPSTSGENVGKSDPSSRKPFSDVSTKHKSRITSVLREKNTAEVLAYAAKQKLSEKRGVSPDRHIGKVIDFLLKNPQHASNSKHFYITGVLVFTHILILPKCSYSLK